MQYHITVALSLFVRSAEVKNRASRDSTLMVDRLRTLGLLRSLLSTVFYNISTVFRVFLLSQRTTSSFTTDF